MFVLFSFVCTESVHIFIQHNLVAAGGINRTFGNNGITAYPDMTECLCV